MSDNTKQPEKETLRRWADELLMKHLSTSLPKLSESDILKIMDEIEESLVKIDEKYESALKESASEKILWQKAHAGSEKKYWNLFRVMAQGAIYFDDKGIINEVNPSAIRILGLPFKEMLGKSYSDLHLKAVNEKGTEMLPDDMPFAKTWKTGKKSSDTFGIFNPDLNKTVWISMVATPVKEEEDLKITGIIATFDDISSRVEIQNAQEALTREIILHSQDLEMKVKDRIVEVIQLSNLNKTIVNSLGLALITTSEDGIITGFNKEAETLLGYTADEVVNVAIPSIFHKSEEIGSEAEKLSEITGKKVNPDFDVFRILSDYSAGKPHEWTYIRKDGAEVPVIISLSQLRDPDGLTVGYLGVVFDNTSRKAAEEKLKESEQRFYRMFTDHSAIMLLVNPETGELVDANKAAREYYGFFIDEYNKLAENINVLNVANDRQEMGAIFSQNRKIFDFHHKKTGEIRTVEVNSSPIEYSGQKILFSIVSDITERKKAEELLRWNEYLLQLMSGSSPFGFLVTDNRTNKILYFNHRFCEIWNITSLEDKFKSGELNYREIVSYFMLLIKDSDAYDALNLDQMDQDKKAVVKNEINLNDNRIIGVFLTQIRSENEEYYGHFFIFEDITERKRTELRLQMQNAAFESFSLSVMITDNTGIIEWVNPAFTTLTGYSVEETIGQNTRVLKSGLTDNTIFKELWETILDGKVWTGELVNKRKDGSLYYEEQTITPILNERGEVSRFIAIKIDVSHRKEMEKALRFSEARWQAALEGSGDGIRDWNTVTNQVYFSSQWKSMLGYDEEEIGNSLSEWSDRVHPDDIRKCYDDLNSHFRGETELYTNEHRMLCKDGTYKWILDRGKVIEWIDKGKPSRVIVTHSNIDEQKRLEASLIESIEKEKELNEMKSRFVSTASHEFRTPLSSILITSDSLLTYWERMEESQIKDKLRKINNQILHLTNIVNDVLQLSKIEEGKIEFNPVDIDIIELCKQVIETFNSDPKLCTKIHLLSPFESVIMKLDSRLIFQSITNLLSNALKYSPENPIVKVEITRKNNELNIAVSDNGVGIPDADQKHIFKAFFRGSNTRLIQGNGLGLSIVKESIKLHGGNITYRSKLGQGTTFIIVFPDSMINSYE